MSTIKRLRRITGEQIPEKEKQARADQINELRRRIETVMSRRPHTATAHPPAHQGRAAELSDLVQGEELENTYGRFFVAHSLHSGSSYHGRRCISEISALDMNAAALLANRPDLSRFHCGDALFLDTETTGLSGGTGTLVFLIGIGWFDNERFVTKQIFARDFSEERASLKFLTDIVREKRFLVTFNGKVFDVGLLTTRFILNRLPDPLSGFPHLDLLYPSRRLLGHRLDNSRLSTLEREVLEFHREDDLPASEIPMRYLNWLRKRDPRLMVDVFEHNRLDVISMAALAVHLAEMTKCDPENEQTGHHDLLAVTRFLLNRGYYTDAKKLLDSLISSEHPMIALEARKKLSLMHKRDGRWNEAIRIWETMLENDPENVFAAEELAKWFEHRAHDFHGAINIVSGILKSSRLSILERDALTHRLCRLRNRTEYTNTE